MSAVVDAADPPAVDRAVALGRAIRSRRVGMGMSQAELARRCGCDRRSVQRIELAKHTPYLDRVFLLADALGLTPSALLALAEEGQ